MKPHCAAAVPIVPHSRRATERTGVVEHALHSIHLSVTHRATLALLDETDLVPIAQALPGRTVGVDLSVHRVRSTSTELRVGSFHRTMNRGSGVAALAGRQSGRGGGGGDATRLPSNGQQFRQIDQSYAPRELWQNIAKILNGINSNDSTAS